MQENNPQLSYDGLLSRLFSKPRRENDYGFVIGITSPQPGAGVSTITHSLALELGQDDGGSVAALPFSQLLQLDPRELGGRYHSELRMQEVELRSESRSEPRSRTDWHHAQLNRAAAIDALRRSYDYVLIDAPSLKSGYDALSLAPMVDGMILIVEANKTKKEQILYAERAIRGANGRLLGHILNKRTYTIPQWLYSKLDAVGL